MKPRVRFAPAPTGLMHLGNVRTALLNYLYATKNHGTFILRLEDTDPDRNFDPNGQQIIKDLAWLGINFHEGPTIGGPFAPYQQSLRTAIYEEKLNSLKKQGTIYKCFCSQEELEQKRLRQIALKLPPRYDRTCTKLSDAQIQQKLSENIAFLWRFKVPDQAIIHINELARGKMTFEAKNFSDFPLTRSDGTFTFIFSNAIDDMLMEITHVLRGEDHLSNTVNQIMIMEAFGYQAPLYWHLPIICNVEGKKLSKRDFGFSLNDLRNGGYLPQAINNYLAILGGSYEQEIMGLDHIIESINFDHLKTAGQIKYDPEKLRWLNHKWMQLYDLKELTALLAPILIEHYPQAKNLDAETINTLIKSVRSELYVLLDVIPALNFYFQQPILTRDIIREHIPDTLESQLFAILADNITKLEYPEDFLKNVKEQAAQAKIPNKILFASLRLMLTGSIQGAAIHDILTILGHQESRKRIENIIAS